MNVICKMIQNGRLLDSTLKVWRTTSGVRRGTSFLPFKLLLADDMKLAFDARSITKNLVLDVVELNQEFWDLGKRRDGGV